jgi:hypothetical protein
MNPTKNALKKLLFNSPAIRVSVRKPSTNDAMLFCFLFSGFNKKRSVISGNTHQQKMIINFIFIEKCVRKQIYVHSQLMHKWIIINDWIR